MKTRFSREARGDLRDIVQEIAAANPRAARRVRDAITRVATTLAETPLIGPHVGPGPLRRIVSAPYLIFYHVAPDVVTIVRVLHGARDLDPLLREPGHAEPDA